LFSSSSSSSLVPKKLEIKESPVIAPVSSPNLGVTSLPALFGLLSGTGVSSTLFYYWF
jgi:hypothetical protein